MTECQNNKSNKQVVLTEADLCRLVPFFTTRLGRICKKPILHLLAVDKVNALYGRCCHARGYRFSTLLLDDLKITPKIINPEMLEQFPQSGFITVSNHPFGAIDGIALISVFGSIRPDYKVMVNSLLNYIEAMSPNFIAVEPYVTKKGSRVNMQGIKDTLVHLKEGHPMGFFPAGGVSKIQHNLRIQDKPWAENVIRLIQLAKLPVIPVYFHGHNTLFFYLLGMISWRIRTLRLIPEVFHARGRTLCISLGEPIPVEVLQKYAQPSDLGAFLRSKTYETGHLNCKRKER